jgi:ABC-type sugar transport system substrate-binding protein
VIELLLRNRESAALSAAAAIEVGLQQRADVVALSPAERAAVVSVLEEAWRTK